MTKFNSTPVANNYFHNPQINGKRAPFSRLSIFTNHAANANANSAPTPAATSTLPPFAKKASLEINARCARFFKTRASIQASSRAAEMISPTTSLRAKSMTQIHSSAATATRASSKRDKLSTTAVLRYVNWITIASLLSLTLQINFISIAEGIKLQLEGGEKNCWSGDQVIVTCQNNNNIKNVKMRWFGPDRVEIRDLKSGRLHTESTGPHSLRLIIMSANSKDRGLYKCTLGATDDRTPKEVAEFNLTVFQSPTFNKTEQHSVQKVGELGGQLACHFEIDSRATNINVSWLRDGSPIEALKDTTYIEGPYEKSRQMSVLEIKPLNRTHDGIYTCRVSADINDMMPKIFEVPIRLETQYAPIFDTDEYTVWIERNAAAAVASVSTGNHHNAYGASAGASRNYPNQNYRVRHFPQPVAVSASPASNNSVRVELKCTSQANPPATILWSSSSQNVVLAQGQPEHVIEEPRQIIEGHNTTSILTLNFSLDQNWLHKDDTYTCSASNLIGQGSKRFKIEQGDLPPAFSVAPNKTRYYPETKKIEITVIGPDFDPDTTRIPGKPSELHTLLPKVDWFRVRTEEQLLTDGKLVKSATGVTANKDFATTRLRASQAARQHLGGDMTADYSADSDKWFANNSSKYPQDFNVKLVKLPAGAQRLYLEAHNAVGWSPNATFLGDFVIVSSATSLVRNVALFWLLLVIQIFYNLRWF